MSKKRTSIFSAKLMVPAIGQALKKLSPIFLLRNPVMLLCELAGIATLVQTFILIFDGKTFGMELQISFWLLFTVIFSNFAESLAEGRGKAQAETLRQTRSEAYANLLQADGSTKKVTATSLKKGDVVIVNPTENIPSDGDIIDGVCLVDESAITGESAPVVRESGGDRSGVTGGTKVLTGVMKVRITTNPGETFIDQMISMVEGAKRQKTPNELALEILLLALTVVFMAVTVTLVPFASFSGTSTSFVVLVSLLVCLIPTTISGLLPAIGIAGMDRLISKNVIALSGRAVEASGDVNVVLLDKTGTITLGNRLATELMPAHEINHRDLARGALLSSLADSTPEGRSILNLSKDILEIKGREIKTPVDSVFVPFSAETRMSGIDLEGRCIRKGAPDTMKELVESKGGVYPDEVVHFVDDVAKNGGTPLVVVEDNKVLGVVRLKDVLKDNIKQRLHQLRQLGIKSVMITGDNPLTAASIAAEAGIDDFVAQARPENKLELIRNYQANGHLVAMIGDGTNDAPALAQSDVGVAMNAGTQAAREAANMVDLDSNPSKLLDIVEIGKQILITRGALTTFSVANDLAKYFAILPSIFVTAFPQLGVLNVMALNPATAVLSAVIFNALVIPALIPLSLKGVTYRPMSAGKLLRHNLLVYGLGGLALPFVGIKLIDLFLNLIGIGRIP
jgi:K+-transporting ATPase ATPase B chain